MSQNLSDMGKFFFIGIPGSEIDAQTEKLLKEIKPTGVCLFARNIKTLEQTRELTDGLREYGVKLISIDQEGGLVDRLRRVLVPMPSADRLKTSNNASEHGKIIGNALSMLGINMDFAPVVDISATTSSISNGILTRTFGTDAQNVTELAEQFLDGLATFGVIGCLKHFPGLGKATVDSHEELPFVDINNAAFLDQEILPYKRLISTNSVRAIMVAHAAFPNVSMQEIDAKGRLLPSSLSEAIITGLLRQQLDFKGLIVSDDMEMGAILRNYGIGDACVMAINAGTDLVAICAGVDAIYKSYEAIEKAVSNGKISNEIIASAMTRIDNITFNIQQTVPFDLETLENIKQDITLFSERLNKETGG